MKVLLLYPITDACREKLAQDGYQPSMGARPKRVFEDNVKNLK